MHALQNYDMILIYLRHSLQVLFPVLSLFHFFYQVSVIPLYKIQVTIPAIDNRQISTRIVTGKLQELSSMLNSLTCCLSWLSDLVNALSIGAISSFGIQTICTKERSWWDWIKRMTWKHDILSPLIMTKPIKANGWVLQLVSSSQCFY